MPPPTLVIASGIYESVLAHVRRAYPYEACGIVAGGAGLAERHVELVNSARSPVAFDVEPVELLRVYHELDTRGEDITIMYHSHPHAPAYPSQTDIACATNPDAHYVIVSVLDREIEEFRSFRIADELVTEERVIVKSRSGGERS